MSAPFRYGPTTPHVQNQMDTNMLNNFQQAFEPNRPLLDATDYTNKNQVLHNNLNDNLLNERIVEYRVIINSADRDRLKFPSPFRMQTSFGNTNNEPHIDQAMTNVKYVTLNSVIVPRTVAIDTSQIDLQNKKFEIYPTSSFITGIPIPSAKESSWLLDSLASRPFLNLRVKELDVKHLMGSSPLFQRDTFMLIPDQRLGDMYLYKPRRSTVIYPNSLLKNLNMFTLNLLDEKGKDIHIIDHEGKRIIGQHISDNVPYDYNTYVDRYQEDRYVEYTDCNTQVIYDFTFGVIENELNTKTNYNKT